MSGEHDDLHLLLAFDSDSKTFVRGVEVGHVWTLLEAGEFGPFTMHQTNTEMVMRMAESLDLDARCDLVDDDCWMHVQYSVKVANPEGGA